jgi:hypothetical protein
LGERQKRVGGEQLKSEMPKSLATIEKAADYLEQARSNPAPKTIENHHFTFFGQVVFSFFRITVYGTTNKTRYMYKRKIPLKGTLS